jgi:site-specific recombinase XerD
MTRTTAATLAGTDATTSPTLLEMMPRFRRHLQAENKAAKTVTSYTESVHRLHEFLAKTGMPQRVAAITSEHVEAFLADQLARLRPASARVRYASLRQFFGYLVALGEVPESPMVRMRPPSVPEQPVPVLSEDELRALVRTVERDTDFLARRDAALIRLFLDSGARLSEVSALRLGDVDLDTRTVTFLGKGRRVRVNPITSKTVRAVDKYLMVRDRHPDRDLPTLWLGTQGQLTSYGVAEAVKRRAASAGLGSIHVHQLRHSAAHYLRLAGMDDDSVMRLMGWKDRSMLSRYGASMADARAHAAFRRLAPAMGDRL